MSLWLVACGAGPATPADSPGDGDEPSASGDPSGDVDPAAGDDDGSTKRADADGGGKSPGKSKGLPSSCADDSEPGLCVPPPDFVKKLCAGDYPNVALYMFSQGTPWTRGWLAHETKAVNASGGGSSGEKMKRDEELIVLRKFEGSSPGGIKVSGNNGGFDAMRWDGMCVTLDASEIYFDAPPARIENARIIWNRIEYDIREKLKEDDGLRKTYIDYKNACRGVTVGAVTADCEKLDGVLSRTLAAHLREKGGFPLPSKLPE
ncbi:MAG: hypothetical protein KC731_27815 [Myxococcales bacterium]|nr:hypothetical protein [Myxococcales bacterium]